MSSSINMTETGIEMQEGIGKSFLQRHLQPPIATRAAKPTRTPRDTIQFKESKISQGEIDEIILKESKKMVEYDDLPKGVLKKILTKINRQSFQEDLDAEIDINGDYSFEDIQSSSLSLDEKMRICNEVCFFKKETKKMQFFDSTMKYIFFDRQTYGRIKLMNHWISTNNQNEQLKPR